MDNNQTLLRHHRIELRFPLSTAVECDLPFVGTLRVPYDLIIAKTRSISKAMRAPKLNMDDWDQTVIITPQLFNAADAGWHRDGNEPRRTPLAQVIALTVNGASAYRECDNVAAFIYAYLGLCGYLPSRSASTMIFDRLLDALEELTDRFDVLTAKINERDRRF